MSYTFSRRAFLKYSAVTAVAAMGAGMLGGCSTQDPNNPSRTSLGKITNMQISATLESFNMTTGAFTFSLLSGRTNPEMFDRYCIAIKVLDENKKTLKYYDGDDLSFEIKSGFANRPYLKTNDEAVFNFKIKNFTAVKPGQTVYFQYIPVSDAPSYSMIWSLTNPKKAASGSSSTTK